MKLPQREIDRAREFERQIVRLDRVLPVGWCGIDEAADRPPAVRAGLFEPFGDLAEQIQPVERPGHATSYHLVRQRREYRAKVTDGLVQRRGFRFERLVVARANGVEDGMPGFVSHDVVRERGVIGAPASAVAHERVELEAVALRAVEGVLQNACMRDHQQAAAFESPAQRPSQFELHQFGRPGGDRVGVELMEPHVVQLVLGEAAVFPRRGWRKHDVAIDVVVEDRHALANRTGQQRSAHGHVHRIGSLTGILHDDGDRDRTWLAGLAHAQSWHTGAPREWWE